MVSFYLTLIKRQSRLLTVQLFCIAVTIACAVTFSISTLSDRLEQLFTQQSKEVLAADILLKSTSPLSVEQQSIITSASLQTAETLVFQTMANANEEFMLASVKAVSDNYPLRGKLETSMTVFGETVTGKSGPSPGEVWVESRILHQLKLSVGDSIKIGEASFPVSRVLVFEPDRGGSFYSFTPRIMMHSQDVAATEIVQPGSRVQYGFLFSGGKKRLNDLRKTLAETLRANQQFVTIDEASEALATTIQRAYRFLHVTGLIAILLGAVATALVSYQYTNEMTYQYAVLRCIGLRGVKLIVAVLFPFFLYTFLAIILGLITGAAAHLIILDNLDKLVPEQLPAASYKPYLISILTTVVIVVSFSWPFLRKLLRTSPKLLLTTTEESQPPIFLTIATGAAGLFVLVQAGTSDWYLSITILLSILLFTVIAYFLIKGIIRLFIYISMRQSIHARLAARNISADRRMTSSQTIAVGITVFCLALIYTLRDDMLSSWQSKVPADAPNFFVTNLFEKDKTKFLDEMARLGISGSQLYPIVRGRLTSVNEQPVRDVVSKESGGGDNALNRDLALTSAYQLPKDNVLQEGQWHMENNPLPFDSISIESKLAERLGLAMGDTLGFTVDTATISGKITSIRSVEWESFTPNFYMIFAPGNLNQLPTTYIGSFRLDRTQRSLIPEFVKNFPNASFFDVNFLLTRIQGIAKQISFAIEIILYFALFASLIVFIAIEVILHRSRVYTTAIYKAVGAQTKLIKQTYLAQFLIVGFSAGIFAYTLNLIIGFALSEFIIEGKFIFNYTTAFICLILTPLLIVSSGIISVHKSQQTPAKKLLEMT